jgi:hypothetical protein
VSPVRLAVSFSVMIAACAAGARAGESALAAGRWERGERLSGEGEGKFYGRLKTELRWESAGLRDAHDQEDLDLYQWLTLGADGLVHPQLDARFVARFSKDLDGAHGVHRGEDVFGDARDDIRDGARDLLQVYTAYARFRDLGGAVDVTAGRQSVHEVEWAHFDGVSFEAKRLGGAVSLGGFFGRRAVLWRDFDEKLIEGGHLTWHALETLDFTVSDVYYVENSLGVRAAWSPKELVEGLLVEAGAKLIDEDLDEVGIAAEWSSADLGLEATLSWKRHFLGVTESFHFDYTWRDRSVERLNLSDLDGFDDWEARLYKRIVRPFGVFAGLLRRQVFDHRAESAWETSSYWQPSGGADLEDWPWYGLRVDGRFTWADFHRPAVPAGAVFDEKLRGEGERDWFEVFVEVRQKLGKLALLGFEYTYREFDYRSKFRRERRLPCETFRVYARLDIGEIAGAARGLSVRIDYWNEEDDAFVYRERIERAEGVWAAVEYTF